MNGIHDMKVYDTKLKRFTTVKVAFIIPDDSSSEYKHLIVYDGTAKGDNALWVEDPNRFTIRSRWHIHWFKPIGDWTGYTAKKRCRCGEERTYDIY